MRKKPHAGPSLAPHEEKPATTSLQTTVRKDAIRETVESVVIAFVLAFVFRCFEAEAYVIPTGSMSPTLRGRHKDLICEHCGHRYHASATDEVDRDTNALIGDVIRTTCPMCRHQQNIDPERAGASENVTPTYNGDRILVSRVGWQPEPYDVGVFLYPQDASIPYIKRIVGVPHEEIRIHAGDLYVRKPGEAAFQIRQKPPKKLLAMLQLVYDQDYYKDDLLIHGWGSRWQHCPEELDSLIAKGWPQDGAWDAATTDGWLPEGLSEFKLKKQSGRATWLRYQHITPPQWSSAAELERLTELVPPRPMLINDWSCYNDVSSRRFETTMPDERGVWYGLDWVGDLAVSCEITLGDTSEGELILELIEAGTHYQCRIDLARGQATLFSGEAELAQASVEMDSAGTYTLLFSNMDDRLDLWVNDTLADFGGKNSYAPGFEPKLAAASPGNTTDLPEFVSAPVPTVADLSPVGLAARGVDAQVRHLKVYRDIYYIASRNENPEHGAMSHSSVPPELENEFRQVEPHLPRRKHQMFAPSVVEYVVRANLATPSAWASLGQRRSVTFPLNENQFLALGDNSARSADSRFWGTEHYVDKELLVGEAFMIYWPHGWEKVPGTSIPVPLHLFPDFKGMRLIH